MISKSGSWEMETQEHWHLVDGLAQWRGLLRLLHTPAGCFASLTMHRGAGVNLPSQPDPGEASAAPHAV